jgi:transcriptional regulator with XRE-family HTH domain
MTSHSSPSDLSVLQGLGERLLRHRLDRNLTQADLALAAGVSKRTVERLEAGESTQLSNFIRILRALSLLDGLDTAIPTPPPSPIDQLKLQGKQRRRASAPRKSDVQEDKAPWTWRDEP